MRYLNADHCGETFNNSWITIPTYTACMPCEIEQMTALFSCELVFPVTAVNFLSNFFFFSFLFYLFHFSFPSPVWQQDKIENTIHFKNTFPCLSVHTALLSGVDKCYSPSLLDLVCRSNVRLKKKKLKFDVDEQLPMKHFNPECCNVFNFTQCDGVAPS